MMAFNRLSKQPGLDCKIQERWGGVVVIKHLAEHAYMAGGICMPLWVKNCTALLDRNTVFPEHRYFSKKLL